MVPPIGCNCLIEFSLEDVLGDRYSPQGREDWHVEQDSVPAFEAAAALHPPHAFPCRDDVLQVVEDESGPDAAAARAPPLVVPDGTVSRLRKVLDDLDLVFDVPEGYCVVHWARLGSDDEELDIWLTDGIAEVVSADACDLLDLFVELGEYDYSGVTSVLFDDLL